MRSACCFGRLREIARHIVPVEQPCNAKSLETGPPAGLDVSVQEKPVGRAAVPGMNLLFRGYAEEIELFAAESLPAAAGGVSDVQVICRILDGIHFESLAKGPPSVVLGRIQPDAINSNPVGETKRPVRGTHEQIKRTETGIGRQQSPPGYPLLQRGIERKNVASVVGVREGRQGELPDIVQTLNRPSPIACPGEGGQQQARQDGNDGNHDQQFNQRERNGAAAASGRNWKRAPMDYIMPSHVQGGFRRMWAIRKRPLQATGSEPQVNGWKYFRVAGRRVA